MEPKELDIMTDHFPISEEEIMRAIETGQSEKFILRSVGRGGNFRGYVITDSKYGVRIADYIYNHSKQAFELKMKPNYQEELEQAEKAAVELEAVLAAKKEAKQKAKKYKLYRRRVATTLGAGAIAAIMFFTGIKVEKAMMTNEANDPTPVNPVVSQRSNFENCDYRLCIRYLDYSLGYLDSIILNPNTHPNAVAMLTNIRDNLRTNYANRAYAAAYDVEDYKSMPGFEEMSSKAEEQVRKYTEAFEEEFVEMVHGAKSFYESPLNGAFIVDSKSEDGRDVEIVYIPESLENYADGKVPEGSITKDGLLYVPLNDSARYEGVKVK